MIEVVSAVIIRNGRILLTQRREGKDFPFTWECPGGKVDGNESHHDALRRECMEELGLNVMIGPDQALWVGEFPLAPAILLLMYRAVPYDNGVPKPLEGQGIGWFTAEEMAALKLTPGNQKALGRIVAVMAMGARS